MHERGFYFGGPRRQRKPGFADASHAGAVLRFHRVNLLPGAVKEHSCHMLGMSEVFWIKD